MSIKASEILEMMKRLGFRVTGYGRQLYEDDDFCFTFARGTKKVRGNKGKQAHKKARRLRSALFPLYSDINWSDSQRHFASDRRRPYGFLRAQFDSSQGDTSQQRYMRLAIDNGKAWNKPASCPVLLYAGALEDGNELQAWSLSELERRLRKACGKLATKAGHDASCHFEYDMFMLASNG